MATSFANGGQLSASNAEVWTQASTVLKGLKWMLRKDAPLLVNPKPDWHKLSWMAEFVGNIRNYQNHTIETTRLAIAARAHLQEWAAKESIEFNYEQRGILHIYGEKSSYEHATRVNELLKAGGLDRTAVSETQMREIEPTLVGDFYGGYYTPSDATGDIHKYTRGLADACVRLGADFQCDTSVEKVVITENGVAVRSVRIDPGAAANENVQDFDGVVICAGVGSREIAAQLEDRVNIYPVKGYSITVDLDDDVSQKAAPWVSILNRDIRDDRIRPLIEWCRRYFPEVDTEHVVSWAGLRPMMPSMMPKIGAGKHAGVFYNTGHGHLGWTLSPITAEMVSDIVLQQFPHEQSTIGEGLRATG